MKIHALTPLLAPPIWGYSAGFAFGSLAAVLGSEHPDLVTAAFRAVGFMLSFPLVGLLASLDQPTAPDWERRDWQAARERVVTEEREATEYQQVLRPGNLALGCANGQSRTQVFHFPAGITLDHLTAFGSLIASGKPPVYRNLKTTFDHALWSDFRDWLMVAEYNKFGILAEYKDGRDAWDVNGLGRRLAIIWLCKTSPTDITSKAIKCGITRNKTIKTTLETI